MMMMMESGFAKQTYNINSEWEKKREKTPKQTEPEEKNQK